ncbi:MAG: oxidoreductase [Euryarchaeota archaeon]|nr:oxidoreductase [Euryarchaeota archaeon]|tara:strand:+ start:1488 stop:2450 length:963 start_codon:yes stop_codon:yes gene_type:complete
MGKKVCVVGGGYWGSNHIKALYELGVLGGIVEEDTKLLKKHATQYPDIKCFSSIDSAISDKKFAGFTVATPSETHYNIAKRLINAGNNVLVEKPLAFSVEHAKELLELSIKNKVLLMVGHVLLFHPAIRKIKTIIDNDEIGDLQYIYSNRLNLGQVRTEENAFWSLAPHDIAIFQYFINEFPDFIQASGSSFLQHGIQDSTLTYLKYKCGVEGHIFVSWLHPFKEHRLVVVGSKAMITFEDSINEKPLKLYSKRFDFLNGIPEKVDGPVDLIHYDKTLPLTAELDYFVKTINSGKDIEISNGNHALDVIRILVKASEQLN